MDYGEQEFIKKIENLIKRMMMSMGYWLLVIGNEPGLIGSKPESPEVLRALEDLKTRIDGEANRLGRDLTPHDYSQLTVDLLKNHSSELICEMLIGLQDYIAPGRLNVPVSSASILVNLGQIDLYLIYGEADRLFRQGANVEKLLEFAHQKPQIIARAAEVLAVFFSSPYKDRSNLCLAYEQLSDQMKNAVGCLLAEKQISIYEGD